MEQSRRILVRTLNSVYEVWVRGQRFRRTKGSTSGTPPLDQWRRFHRLGPIVTGRPMRLWLARSHAGKVSHVDVLTTAPVVEVTVDETEEPSFRADQDHPGDGQEPEP
jgi:hypothetical protein